MKILKVVGHIIIHMVSMAIVFVVCFGIALLLHFFIKFLELHEIGVYVIYVAKGVKYFALAVDVVLFCYAEIRLGKSLINQLRKFK